MNLNKKLNKIANVFGGFLCVVCFSFILKQLVLYGFDITAIVFYFVGIVFLPYAAIRIIFEIVIYIAEKIKRY